MKDSGFVIAITTAIALVLFVFQAPQTCTAIKQSDKGQTLALKSTRKHLSEAETKSGTSTQTPNVTESREEIRVRLGEEEMVDCFRQTKIGGFSWRPIFNWSHLISFKATPFYKEVQATKGSIIGEIKMDKERLRNISQNLNESMECRVFRDLSVDEYCCALRVRVPKGLYIVIKVPELTGSALQLYGVRGMDHVYFMGNVMYPDFKVTEGNLENTRVYLGSSNVVSITQIVRIGTKNTTNRFVLHFHGVGLSDLQLQVLRTSLHTGLVMSPLYQRRALYTTAYRCKLGHVRVHSGHVIAVSTSVVNRKFYQLYLYAGDRGNETLLKLNPDCVLRFSIFNTSSLLVVFDYEFSLFFRESQLYFSFHNRSSLPVKLADNSWNCSVPYSSGLLHHLSCNTEVECRDFEDEMDCPYTTELCGPGYMTLGGACFFYLQRQGDVSLVRADEVSDMCLLRGGRLASLNTVAKWTDALRMVFMRKPYEDTVAVGIKSASASLPQWYAKMFQWDDGTTAFFIPFSTQSPVRYERTCGDISVIFCSAVTGLRNKCYTSVDLNVFITCKTPRHMNGLCQKPFPQEAIKTVILINGTSRWPLDTAYIVCPTGHYTHQFSACDVKTTWWSRDYSSQACESPQTPLPPFFTCSNGIMYVPYALVCDHRADCADGSDENFCSFLPCVVGEVVCWSGQCIPSTKLCDGWENCYSGDDEQQCLGGFNRVSVESIPPPALVTLDLTGHLVVRPLNSTLSHQPARTCPHTHFQCLDNGYCLPMILRCNDVYDCPGREDEGQCDTCPGFYRCRGSKVCLLHSDLCDGHAHCPQHDDELMCNSTCPPSCVCRGLAFFCRGRFPASVYPLLRYLDAGGSAMLPGHLADNLLLVHLSLANCGLVRLDDLVHPNLLSLDVHDNQLKTISHLHLVGVPQLRELSVAGNPLSLVFEDAEEPQTFGHLVQLDLSRVVLHVLNVTVLTAFPKLHVLNLSHSGVVSVVGEGFRVLQNLRVVDLRGCPITWFPPGMLRNLDHLQAVYAHRFRVCCPAMLPVDFNLHNCFSQASTEISSCDNLLRGNLYRVCVFVLPILALIGNSVSFIFRSYVYKRENKRGYGNFVTHLSVSDFIMGIYLAIIGVADQVYRGTYLWNEEAWKQSVPCKISGFMSLLSSEVSALIMCLISLDRFLVLRFPFSRLHFSPRSAHTASGVAWIGGVLLASIPLLPVTSHWEFYSQTGICISLPITSTYIAGYRYSFGVLVVFNFVVFDFISLGQLSIYWSVRANSMSVSNTTKKTKELTIARRLITVAMTDFLCWFPVGVLGLLASNGVSIPGEVNLAVAIFVLPLNSAVNPCLYTLNVILERRRLAREEELRRMLLATMKTNK